MYFFDESGDPGKPDKSNSQYFVIAAYKINSTEEIIEDLKSVRKLLNISDKRKSIKWQKLDKARKLKFNKVFFTNLVQKMLIIHINKNQSEIHGELLYSFLLEKLIRDNKITGKMNYTGIHLNNMLHNLKRKLKSNGIKINFQNNNDLTNPGVQICDLVAGFIHQNLKN